MPIPNDFRLNGALGGWMAGEEYSNEQKKQELANLLTQANTAQINQGTDEKTQLLPLLLQQREQENQIRAKSALEAQLGMANVPQEVANQGLAGQLAGLKTQGDIDSFPETQAIAGMERKGKRLSLEQQNQLRALEHIAYIKKFQGDLAAAASARDLGMNPQVLFDNPDMLEHSINTLKSQMVDTPAHRQDMVKEELKSVTDLEKARINADASRYGADKSAEARIEAERAKAQKGAAILSMDKQLAQYIREYNDIANDPSATPQQKQIAYDKAEQMRQTVVSMKRDPQLMLDPNLQSLVMSQPSQAQPLKKIHEGSTSSGRGSGNGTPKRIKFDAQGNVIQ